MSRLCELSGVGVMSGNNVSHSERKTRRKFLPNLRKVSLMSDLLSNTYSFRVAARAIKTVEMHGGLDGYLLKAKDSLLSKNALTIKAKLKKLINTVN